MAEDNRAEQRKKQDEAILKSLSKIKHKLLVMSGKGGVGKTTVAVNLAIALSKNYKVGLMDVDLHGPNIPYMLGIDEKRVLSDGKFLQPIEYSDNLKVISIESMLSGPDAPVIWRGPLKTGIIRQFISDVDWDELDFLIVDSPPGTGDEPLTVAQTIFGVKSIIVTTPQEISLTDVRKSINFSKSVNMPILGIVENMSGFACPNCGHKIDLFKTGGGERTAKMTKTPFLGKIPFDPKVVDSGDEGKSYLDENKGSEVTKAFEQIVERILKIEVSKG